MERITPPNIRKLCCQDNSFEVLRKQFKKVYQKQGESKRCVNYLNSYANNYYKTFKQSLLYKSGLQKLMTEAENSKKHISLSFVKNETIKVSLHIMPKGFEIPPHAHPNQFSLIIVEAGVLEIEQFSWGTDIAQEGTLQSLKQGESCIGLPIKDNLHHLTATSECVIFLSIKMKSVERGKQEHLSLLSVFTRKLTPSVLCLLLPVASCLTANAGETYELYSGFKGTAHKGVSYKDSGYQKSKFSIKKSIKPKTRHQAGQFRQSSHYESQVEAVTWYLNSARRGNAESQYWLGVMHLDGSGTTEDDDEAFKWISLAADQNYKPAVILLNHLITSEFDLEC
jgi:hypothetical protein